MKRVIVLLFICFLFGLSADRPPPAEASPAVGRLQRQAEEPVRAAPEEEWTVTAYCPCERCCGRWAHYRGGGWTASGVKAKAGVTVAVDPAVIPLGSRVWIEGVGWRIAQDTGSAVRGRHVDIFVDNHKTAIAFGVQRRIVVVVKE